MLLHIDGRNNTSPKVTSLIDKEKERNRTGLLLAM